VTCYDARRTRSAAVRVSRSLGVRGRWISFPLRFSQKLANPIYLGGFRSLANDLAQRAKNRLITRVELLASEARYAGHVEQHVYWIV